MKENNILFTIQLAKYADKNPEAIKYLSVYEPLIRILERGGAYTLRINSLDVENAAHYPLNQWY